jgi:hypothetical protein
VIVAIAAAVVVSMLRGFGVGDPVAPPVAADATADTGSVSEPDVVAPAPPTAGHRSEPLPDAPSAPLIGVVVDDGGRPIADAEVAAGPRLVVATDEQTNVLRAFDPARSRSVRTAADGSFRIEGLATGRVDVAARAPGYFPAALVDLKVDSSPGSPLELRLSPARTLDGVVTTVFGQPVADASVIVDVMDWRADDAARRETLTREAQSDATGRFRIEGLPPLRPLRARTTARGYLIGKAVRIAPNERTVAIELEASPVVLLQVIDMDSGKALSDFEVAFADEGRGGLGRPHRRCCVAKRPGCASAANCPPVP